MHEFHVWQLAGDRIIASAHIRCRNLSEYMKIAEKVKEFFHNEGIHSTTIQPEFVEGGEDGMIENNSAGVTANGAVCTASDGTNGRVVNGSGSQDGCALDCPITDQGCVQATCCQTNNKVRRRCKWVKRNLLNYFFAGTSASHSVFLSIHAAATTYQTGTE